MRLDLKWENPEKTVLTITDTQQRTAYKELTGRDYIRLKDIPLLRKMGFDLTQLRDFFPEKKNRMQLGNIKKMLQAYKEHDIAEDIQMPEIDKSLQRNNVEEIVNILGESHLVLYIELN